MATLCLEMKKIVGQFCGSQNIFGYKSTVANQLYLLYCLCGKIYFTDKIDKRVKYLWYIGVSCLLLLAYVIGLAYLLYDEKNDIVLMLNVVNPFGSIHVVVLGFPAISYLYSGRIEAMIELVDNILTVGPGCDFKHKKVLEDAMKYFSRFLTPLVICSLVYLLAGVLDVVLFFEEHKVQNYFYYACPPPLVQNRTSVGSFFITIVITSIMFAFLAIEVWSVFSLILYWNIICCDQFISIADELRARTCKLHCYSDAEVQLLREWNATFKCAVKRSIDEFQKTSRLINYLKEFAEAIGTFFIVAGFFYGVAMLYVCCSDDLPLVLKVKCAMGYTSTTITVFLFYFIGQNLDNSVLEVSLAVYSTPWYRSVKIRKTVYIFLSQTQSVKNFSVLKVYGLLLNNFSRHLHGLVSCTNILRRLTNK